ncbi:MAG TPA: prenyltransferase [Bacteroidetes bacterium]|nr:prenyltransferase [Bacteroidota bacterium]
MGSIISQKTLFNETIPPLVKVILTFFTALFLEASTFALNDYYDLQIDKINKRTDRPLVRGDIQPKTALYLFYVFFPLGLLCSFFVNMTCFIIALITALLSVLYDAKMKKIKLIGNFYIAYIMAIPFIFGGATVLDYNTISFSGINPAIYTIAFIAFIAGAGREMMKDVMDFEGDKKKGVKSFPKYIGVRKSNIISGLFYILAVILSFIPYLLESFSIYYHNIAYLLIVLITDIILVYVSLQLIFNKSPNMKLFRKLSLVAIFIGLIAFLISAFVNI